jgi:small subunit ribosomal protein S1
MKIKKVSTPMGALIAKEPRLGGQLKEGNLIEGAVLEKTGSAVYVDLPPYGTGIIYGREYREAKDIIRGLEPGSLLVGKIVELENDDGYVEISLREAGKERLWEELAGLKAKNATVEVTVVGANRGGLIVELEGTQGFLPVSQLSSAHYPRVKDGDKNKILSELQRFMGQKLGVKIITVSPKEEKLIVSEKEVELAGLSEVLERYKVGDIIEGDVSGVVDFGAFVRFRALPPETPEPAGVRQTTSEARRTPESERNPADDGAEVRQSASFGADEEAKRPRTLRTPEGQSAEGPELEGLIHISELDYKLVTNPADIIKVGERVKAKIIAIDRGRVSLSLKRLKDDPWQDLERRYAKGDLVQGKVIKLDRYGALVELTPGVHGLCHVSEFGTQEAMQEALQLDVSSPFRIAELKPDERKLVLNFLRPASDSPPAPSSEVADMVSE